MIKNTDCIFCALYTKQSFLFEDENFFCIKDKFPKAKLHLLLVSKQHISTLMDCPISITRNIFSSILNNVIPFVKNTLQKEKIDFKIQINNGKLATQEIFHLHTHILFYYV